MKLGFVGRTLQEHFALPGSAPAVRAGFAGILVLVCCGASYRTTNFIVTASDAAQAKAIARDAEQLRRDLALEWLGVELPAWATPCPIKVRVAEDQRPSGSTSYEFRRGRPTHWEMRVEGCWRAIRDSVLPHEVTHTIFATYFGRPIPRWAEEGVCVIVEGEQEQAELRSALADRLRTGGVLAIDRIFTMTEYPRDVHSFYSQGYSLVRFLVGQGGKKKFVAFLQDVLRHPDWPTMARKHYGFANLGALQQAWLQWARTADNVQLTAME